MCINFFFLQVPDVDKDDESVRDADVICNCELETTPEMSTSVSPALEDTVPPQEDNADSNLEDEVSTQEQPVDLSSIQSISPQPVVEQLENNTQELNENIEEHEDENIESETAGIEISENVIDKDDESEEIKFSSVINSENDSGGDVSDEHKIETAVLESTLSVEVDTSEVISHSDVSKLIEREIVDSDNSEAYLTPTEREVDTEEIPQSVSENLQESVQGETVNELIEHVDSDKEPEVVLKVVSDSCSNETDISGCETEFEKTDVHPSENAELPVSITVQLPSKTIDVDDDQSDTGMLNHDDKSNTEDVKIVATTIEEGETNTEVVKSESDKDNEILLHESEVDSPKHEDSHTDVEDKTEETVNTVESVDTGRLI